ncbi:hypothetical protein HDE_12537 [Halotydeus destructor]|nr:hypothetical protein HDE_12537 [Halotydeus destructor]
MFRRLLLVTVFVSVNSLVWAKYDAEVAEAFDAAISKWTTENELKIDAQFLEVRLHHFVEGAGSLLIAVSTLINQWSFGHIGHMSRLGSPEICELHGFNLMSTNLSASMTFEALGNVNMAAMQHSLEVSGTMRFDIKLELQYDASDNSLAVRTYSSDVTQVEATAFSLDVEGELRELLATDLAEVGPRQLKLPVTLGVHDLLIEATDGWNQLKNAFRDYAGTV